VVDEHAAVATVAEEGAAERPDVGRGLDPAGRLRVERAETLQRAVLVLGQQLDAHRRGHLDGAARRPVLLAGGERLGVVAQAPPTGRALGRAVAERDLPRPVVPADHVRLPTGRLHPAERLQRAGVGIQPRPHLGPRHVGVSRRVVREPALQRAEQAVMRLHVHGA
jgi:hypothetical protein